MDFQRCKYDALDFGKVILNVKCDALDFGKGQFSNTQEEYELEIQIGKMCFKVFYIKIVGFFSSILNYKLFDFSRVTPYLNGGNHF
jgi:hypothetical protein